MKGMQVLNKFPLVFMILDWQVSHGISIGNHPMIRNSSSCVRATVSHSNTSLSMFKFWEKDGSTDEPMSLVSSQEKISPSFIDKNSSSNNDIDMTTIEKQVVASAQEQLDIQRIKGIFQTSQSKANREKDVLTSKHPPSQWNIALASATVLSIASLVILQIQAPINFYTSIVVFITTFLVANRDPIQEEDLDDVTGPITRTVGRVTLDSIEKSKPTIQAVAKAVINGDSAENEIRLLRQRIEALEQDNKDLRLIIERRNAIDERSKFYNMDRLKDLARANNIVVGGTKAQLMMRLIEANVLDLNSDN